MLAATTPPVVASPVGCHAIEFHAVGSPAVIALWRVFTSDCRHCDKRQHGSQDEKQFPHVVIGLIDNAINGLRRRTKDRELHVQKQTPAARSLDTAATPHTSAPPRIGLQAVIRAGKAGGKGRNLYFFKLKIYRLNLQLYIFRLQIYNFSLKIKIARRAGNFSRSSTRTA